jgi:hypothetical protein
MTVYLRKQLTSHTLSYSPTTGQLKPAEQPSLSLSLSARFVRYRLPTSAIIFNGLLIRGFREHAGSDRIHAADQIPGTKLVVRIPNLFACMH